ncbi:tryptophan-rich sensory protein [Dyadobacter arcticus]|uniref:Tryptophan-rich sensory protein n=1 Tax=Dyadobacter arcticus TaxID=1078754 RepID=A0ABX0UNX3_9BACT|nr:TspO/MBR family protein [Dyadobacter arcticus]NIJ54637.1 tryptophan-rich sensory protein [Dyadobacter arcticus]
MIFFVANIISFIPAGYNGDEAFYNNFSQPSVAPPDWLFAPMWLFLNITSLIGLYTISNLPANTKNRRSIILLEYIAWILFAIFTFLYFYLKSPILGAVDTLLGLLVVVLVTMMSYPISKKSFWCFLPRLLWLILAGYVSVWVALNNQDIFLSIGPFLK